MPGGHRCEIHSLENRPARAWRASCSPTYTYLFVVRAPCSHSSTSMLHWAFCRRGPGNASWRLSCALGPLGVHVGARGCRCSTTTLAPTSITSALVRRSTNHIRLSCSDVLERAALLAGGRACLVGSCTGVDSGPRAGTRRATRASPCLAPEVALSVAVLAGCCVLWVLAFASAAAAAPFV